MNCNNKEWPLLMKDFKYKFTVHEADILTFGSYKQGSHLEHGLGEGLWVFSVQSTGRLMDHQLAEVWLAVSRLWELDHTSHLHSTQTDRHEANCTQKVLWSYVISTILTLHLSCVAVAQIQRCHEVGVIFLHTCWSLRQLGGLMINTV